MATQEKRYSVEEIEAFLNSGYEMNPFQISPAEYGKRVVDQGDAIIRQLLSELAELRAEKQMVEDALRMCEVSHRRGGWEPVLLSFGNNDKWNVQDEYEVDDIQGCVWRVESEHTLLSLALTSLIGK